MRRSLSSYKDLTSFDKAPHQLRWGSSVAESYPARSFEKRMVNNLALGMTEKKQQKHGTWYLYMAVCQNLVPLVNIKIAGKWMFIP